MHETDEITKARAEFIGSELEAKVCEDLESNSFIVEAKSHTLVVNHDDLFVQIVERRVSILSKILSFEKVSPMELCSSEDIVKSHNLFLKAKEMFPR